MLLGNMEQNTSTQWEGEGWFCTQRYSIQWIPSKISIPHVISRVSAPLLYPSLCAALALNHPNFIRKSPSLIMTSCSFSFINAFKCSLSANKHIASAKYSTFLINRFKVLWTTNMADVVTIIQIKIETESLWYGKLMIITSILRSLVGWVSYEPSGAKMPSRDTYALVRIWTFSLTKPGHITYTLRAGSDGSIFKTLHTLK